MKTPSNWTLNQLNISFKPVYRILAALFVLLLFIVGFFKYSQYQEALEQELILDKQDKQKILNTFNSQPVLFTPNEGQIDDKVKYYAKGASYEFFMTNTGVTYMFTKSDSGAKQQKEQNERSEPDKTKLSAYALKIAFEGASPNTTVSGTGIQPTKINYLIGNDKEKWNTNLPTYSSVTYKALYPGIDLSYKGDKGNLKYEFTVSPNTDPGIIKMSYDGAKSLRISKAGELLINTAWGTLKDERPYVFQNIGGQKVKIDSAYQISGSTVGFKLGQYNKALPLIIDPKLAFSTFIGGSATDYGSDIALDDQDNVYITGRASSSTFPTTAGALDESYNGTGSDCFVAKLNSSGSTLLYSTFIGGGLGSFGWEGISDEGFAIEVDDQGSAYVAGWTSASDFPVTSGAYDTSFNGSCDAFFLKLNPSGSVLMASTFVGGSSEDMAYGLAIDESGNGYMTGYTKSNNFPTSGGAYDTTYDGSYFDGFVVKIDSSATTLSYSTFLGGHANSDAGTDIKVDSGGNAYITGYTKSNNFPTTAGAFDTTITINNAADAFVTKLNASGTGLVYSTYLGYGRGSSLDIDASGNAYITGEAAGASFPTTGGAYDTSYNGGLDAFVSKLNSTGSSLAYSTFLGGGSSEDRGKSICLDSSQNAYIIGVTNSSTFPVTNGSFDISYNGGNHDLFVTKLSPTGSSLVYSSYLGGSNNDGTLVLYNDDPSLFESGIAVNNSGNIYVGGSTKSGDFPSTQGAYDRFKSGSFDSFITKFNLPEITAITVTPEVPNGNNGWNRVPVTTSLSRNQAGTTYYRWNSGSWNTYTSAMSVAQGSNTLSYYSVAGGVTEAIQTEAIKVDTGIPTDPTAATPSHEVGQLSKNRIVTINLSGQFDGVSGVDGFSILWDQFPTTLPDTIKDISNATSIRSPSLADGSWYFHLRTVDYAGNWTSTVHLGPFEISVPAPHGGYSSSTNKCKVCHLVHGSAETSYKLLRNGNTTEARSVSEGSVTGMGNAKATACMYCHDASSGYTAKRPYELSALGVSVKGEHRIGATVIPDSNLSLANRDPLGEGAVLQCYQCHSVHASQTIGQDSDGDGNTDPAADGNIYNSDDSVDSWNTKILRLDPAGDGSILGAGQGGLSTAAWQEQLVTSGAAVKTGFCVDCHNKNSNWLTSYDDDVNRSNKSSHPQGPGADGLMTVGNQQNTVVARHLAVRQGCRGCHSASSGPQSTSRFPHQSVGWRLLYDRYTVSYAGDPAQGIPQMDRVCLRCHSVTDTTQTGSYAQNEEKLCFSCHGIVSINSDAPNIEAELKKASHHPTSDTFGKHTEGEDSDPSKLGVPNRHAECTDCHSVASVTQDGTNPLRGAWGVNPINGAAGTNPTYTKVGTITSQYQLCFKCHSNYTTQPTSGYYKDNSENLITQGNKAAEFNPNNSSFHPVEGPGRNRSEALRRQLEGAGLTPTSTIKCTDCHNSNDTGDVRGIAANSGFRPKGPHGSNYAPVLRKNYKTNNYPLDTGYDYDNFELCFLCHDKDKLVGSSGWATTFSRISVNAHYAHVVKFDEVYGEPTAVCRTCHYNVHSNQKAINTEYVVWWPGGSTWSYYQTPPEGLKSRLVNFAPISAMSGVAPATKPRWLVNLDSVTRSFGATAYAPKERGCTLNCHFGNDNAIMSNRRYQPPAALDTDPLTY